MKRKEKTCDIDTTIKDLVGDSGIVTPIYGGHEITILKPRKFPWHRIFKELINCGYEVWIIQKEGNLTIMTKPSYD